jgi:hypothetical protein
LEILFSVFFQEATLGKGPLEILSNLATLCIISKRSIVGPTILFPRGASWGPPYYFQEEHRGAHRIIFKGRERGSHFNISKGDTPGTHSSISKGIKQGTH